MTTMTVCDPVMCCSTGATAANLCEIARRPVLMVPLQANEA